MKKERHLPYVKGQPILLQNTCMKNPELPSKSSKLLGLHIGDQHAPVIKKYSFWIVQI